MRKTIFLMTIFISFLFISGSSSGNKQNLTKQAIRNKPIPSQVNRSLKPQVDFLAMPLYFIANQGQVDKKARFYAKASGYTLWLTSEGLVFDQVKRQKVEGKDRKPWDKMAMKKTDLKGERQVSRLLFIGANKNVEISAVETTSLKVNYFIGNDKSKWHGDVPTSSAVMYKNIYKNIDLKIYGIEKQIEYDWIVRPGGNAKDIRFAYENVNNTEIDKDGNLIIDTNFGPLTHQKPVSTVKDNDIKTDISVTFTRIKKDAYGFDMPDYDRTKTLIIDPVVLVYSTYLGGTINEWGQDIAVDSSGYAYITGFTESNDFPVQNPYQKRKSGSDYSYDIFVSKISTNGQSLIYSTFLGGSGNDFGKGIAIDQADCVYLTGYTGSINFPLLNPILANQKDNDAFVTKISAGGDRLLYSTYLGGDDMDEGKDIAVDGSGCAYVTGTTNSNDFPTQNAYQEYQPYAVNKFSQEAFVTKISATGRKWVYSTYLGGNGDDVGNGIAVDYKDCAYVTGYTLSSNFPLQSPFQENKKKGDAFVSKFSATGDTLVYSTYLGGEDVDNGLAITVDTSYCAYVTGYTYSIDFPVENPYQYIDDLGPTTFITKFSASGQSLKYSTGLWYGLGKGVAVDSLGCAYIIGDYESLMTPETPPFVYVRKLSSAGNNLLAKISLSGNSSERGSGIAIDSEGYIYVTGVTDSNNFPSQNPIQGYQGGGDAFVSKLVPETPPNDYGDDLTLRLYAYRKLEKGWIIKKEYIHLDLDVIGQPGKVAKYELWRQTVDQSYQKIRTISPDELKLLSITYLDTDIIPNTYYLYKFMAFDSYGNVIATATSEEVGI